MLTGKRAFDGENSVTVFAAILEREPSPPMAAPPLERIVKRCLAKDPDQRFQTARDLKAALAWAMEQPPPAKMAPVRRSWWGAVAAAALVIGALSGFAVSHLRPPPAAGAVRFLIGPPGNAIFSGAPNATVPAPQLAVSPDGRAIAFSASTAGGRAMLWIRRLDDAAARPLPGTENPTDPFWSPDSQWVGFFPGES